MALKNFKTLKFLGKGSYGSVYKVLRLSDGKEYAMKEINIRPMSQREREEAANEIRVLASVKQKYVIRYHEAFVEGDKLYIVTEYARGGDLYTRVKRQKAKNKYFDEEDVWDFFIQICLGIKALHSKNILHRDLKSPNIFLTSSSEIKIGDLGVAKVLKTEDALAKTQVGTPYYVSPEIWKKNSYDSKCDVWSLGILLYEIASLRRPFEADNLKGLVAKVFANKFSALPSTYSRELTTLVRMLLTTNPSLRPTIDEILNYPAVASRLSKYELVEEEEEDVPMRGTIKVPRSLARLALHLPSPAYEKSSTTRSNGSSSSSNGTKQSEKLPSLVRKRMEKEAEKENDNPNVQHKRVSNAGRDAKRPPVHKQQHSALPPAGIRNKYPWMDVPPRHPNGVGGMSKPHQEHRRYSYYR